MALPSFQTPVDVPKLLFRNWQGGRPRKGIIHYQEDEHLHHPHVVKFSGGRSSGLMLITLLENGLLKPERGDVVLFTNTAAEHPATYDFVGKMKRLTETFDIPFFIAQLQTYETVVGGEWRRKLSYRLTNAKPADIKKNPFGYNFRGEVFEEAIAWTGMLPTVHTRICTTLMKMLVTREFLADWFSGNSGIPTQGHEMGQPQCNPKVLHRIHLKNRGQMTFREFANRWEKLSQYPTSRPKQLFKDYTKVKSPIVSNADIQDHVLGRKCALFGDNPVQFITFLGFRSGEDARYQRMLMRNQGGATPGQNTHPPGEYSYAPLFELGIDQNSVKEFWSQQPRKIQPRLPDDLNLSNCVYCFLKGSKNLVEIQRKKKHFERTLTENLQKQCRKHNTPNSLKWWMELESRYARKSRKEATNGHGKPSFGMFGLSDTGYREIKIKATGSPKNKIRNGSAEKHDDDVTLNCECTD